MASINSMNCKDLMNSKYADILVRILESDFRPGDPASLNAFMTSLAPAEERLVSAWLVQSVALPECHATLDKPTPTPITKRLNSKFRMSRKATVMHGCACSSGKLTSQR